MKGECNCIELMNEMLKERNTELGLVFSLSGKRPTTVGLETSLIEKKRGAKPIRMVASYCPFCGVKYPEAVS